MTKPPVNLFFVKERRPLDLSLAAYLSNQHELCVEIDENSTWITYGKNSRDLCYGAVNVMDIIREYDGTRLFIQTQTKHLAPVALDGVILELPVFFVGSKSDIAKRQLKYTEFGKFIDSQFVEHNFHICSKLIDFDSANTYQINEKLKCWAPNWFLNDTFVQSPYLNGSRSYYEFPNYLLDEEAEMNSTRFYEAETNTKFFQLEQQSSWNTFDEILNKPL